MKAKIALLILFLSSLNLWAAEPIDQTNWMSHPDIDQVRLIHSDVNAAEDRGELNRQANPCTVNDGAATINRALYRDKKKLIRKYVLDGGPADSKTRLEYYYDEKTVLRFIYRQRTVANGTQKEERVFFGADGSHLYTDRSETGPGYPDETLIDFVLDPEADFSGPCREQA